MYLKENPSSPILLPEVRTTVSLRCGANGRGDGIAAAYRAGAQMRNPEFGNFAQLYRVHSNRQCVIWRERYV